MHRQHIKRSERARIHGQVSIRHIGSRNGHVVPLSNIVTGDVKKRLMAKGLNIEEFLKNNNLVVNTGRFELAKLIRGVSSAYINRVQVGDCKVGGVVRKTDFPPDMSDTTLVHEVADLSGQPGGTFDIDENSSPDEVVKTDQSVGTPGTLTAGTISTLTDSSGVNFIEDGVNDKDTVTVILNGEDYTLGINSVNSATELEVANPSQLAGSVGYTVQTPGTQALFQKLISGDNFPADDFGSETVVHEAGLLFTDDTLFNRITFYQNDNDLGLVLKPTDIDGTRIDVQLDWLITF